jgi:hypothetical protein
MKFIPPKSYFAPLYGVAMTIARPSKVLSFSEKSPVTTIVSYLKVLYFRVFGLMKPSINQDLCRCGFSALSCHFKNF